MMSGSARRSTSCVALVLGLAVTSQASRASTTQPASPVVHAAIVDSIIHPVSAEYIATTLDRADQAGAALVVLTLRTPGGLVDSTRAIVSRMVAGKTPVAVFVAPSGARAASAGFILILAADVAAMAPGTHIGAAHPVDGSGQKMDDTVSAKAAEDSPPMPARWPPHATATSRWRPRRSARAAPSPKGRRATPSHRSSTSWPLI